MKKFKQHLDERCWPGYKPAPGKKAYAKGSCVKEGLDEGNKSGDSSLHDWFTKSKSSDGKPGWVQLGGRYAGKSCAKQPGQTTKPKCGSSKMAANMSDKEEDAAARRKRQQDPNPNRSGKPINVSTEGKRKMKESLDDYIAKGECPECGGVMISENELTEEKDACYHKVKSRYAVCPSADASGALVKCRKAGADNWGNKTKKENVEVKNFKAFINEVEELDEKMISVRNAVGKTLKVASQFKDTYEKHGYKPVPGTRMEEVEQIDEISSKLAGNYYGAATKQHIKKVGIKPNMYDRIEKDMGKQRKAGVDRALDRVMGTRKTNEEVEELDEVPAWQRKEGKSEAGGLNRKGIESYRRENPGSKLSMAVTTKPSKLKAGSKAANRRK